MITVEEADRLIEEHTLLQPAEPVALTAAQGRILREDLVADRDKPPFDRVMMDGFALNRSAVTEDGIELRVEGNAAAGHPVLTLEHPESACVQVSTGAILPMGADAVIPVEDVECTGDRVVFPRASLVRPRQFIHEKGSDRTTGEVLLHSGTALAAPHIAIAASIGAAEILVGRRPSIAVVSTGDELVDLGRPVETHQIRPSNAHGVEAGLRMDGMDRVHRHLLKDDPRELEEKLDRIVSEHDLVVLSGGVSMGAHDHIPSVMKKLGVECVFHKVRQRPGKPLWFGRSGSGTAVFALPGNPVSSLVCFYRYVRWYLHRSMGGLSREPRRIALGETISFEPNLTYYHPVRIEPSDVGSSVAVPAPCNGSGDYSALGASDGFVELPAELNTFPAGHQVAYYSWRCS